MPRTRFQRADQADSDCVPGSDGNKPLLSTSGSGTVTASVAAQTMNQITFGFTMPAGDPGSEDLGAGSLFTARLDVAVADAQLTFTVRFRALDASCNSLGEANMDEAAFTGNGVKTATATWDPPAATDRYQILVLVTNTNGHSGAAGTITLTSSSSADLVIPDAPVAGGAIAMQPTRIAGPPLL